ncbi:MAG: AAA family ATPase [Acidobacteriota bacterium]|nr:AAA family ATPase [Acidobacteriota bacterium]
MNLARPGYTLAVDIPARDLAALFRSHNPIVLCETVEEKRFESLVREVAGSLNLPVSTWSAASGLSPCHPVDQPKTLDLAAALRLIQTGAPDGVWILKDPQAHLENPTTLRTLRETAQAFEGSTRTLVLVGPSLPARPELDELGIRFEFALPGPEELRGLVRDTVRRLERQRPRSRPPLSPADEEGLATDLQGLTLFEAERALARAIVEDDALSAADRPGIRESKKTLVESGGLLEFFPAPLGLDSVGGLARLKKWVQSRRVGFLPPPGARPIDPPRGLLILGVQGCGKSLAAKAVAASWGLPLLALDAGRLLAPYIGESERNLRDALKRVDRMSPCVLWIDEIEKAFSTSRSSDTDGGVSKRLVASLLTWMQERTSRVFMIATANSVDELPPEMMRKGRFDEIFFVDLPSKEARAEIFALHLKQRGEDPARFDVDRLAAESKGFSGAEIEQAIVSGLYDARSLGSALDTTGILVAIRSTRPLSVVRGEKIAALRSWAAERCVPADTAEA